MKLLTSVILFSVGALAHSGWTIPKYHPSGVYRVAIDASGNSKHVLVRDLNAPTEAALKNAITHAAGLSKADLAKRQNTGINDVSCRDYQLNATDADAAVNDLESQCGSGGFMAKSADYYAIHGDAVAYACNFSDGPNVCKGNDARDAIENKVSEICGDYVAGYDHIRVGEIRYGYEEKDAKFCDGRGTQGKDDD